ncbi:Cytochrome P450 9e2 [Chionoecetes opilio]|uniref:Cytochrome P450 9e2 n=1 Tax=Chionoecetes opilio TaxID=41210 RepID=A0A8J5C0B8_CHIOP|nr:Cytochrome P450 9e2 [Chionoecetes opilio]
MHDFSPDIIGNPNRNPPGRGAGRDPEEETRGQDRPPRGTKKEIPPLPMFGRECEIKSVWNEGPWCFTSSPTCPDQAAGTEPPYTTPHNLRLFALPSAVPGAITHFTKEPGELVQVPIWCLPPRPSALANPEAFIPDRFLPENKGNIHPFTHMPFGMGPGTPYGLLCWRPRWPGPKNCLLKAELEVAPGFPKSSLHFIVGFDGSVSLLPLQKPGHMVQLPQYTKDADTRAVWMRGMAPLLSSSPHLMPFIHGREKQFFSAANKEPEDPSLVDVEAQVGKLVSDLCLRGIAQYPKRQVTSVYQLLLDLGIKTDTIEAQLLEMPDLLGYSHKAWSSTCEVMVENGLPILRILQSIRCNPGSRGSSLHSFMRSSCAIAR